LRLVEVGLRLAEGRRVGRRLAEVGREVVSEVSIGRQGSPERSSEVVRGRQQGLYMAPERSPEVVSKPYWRPCKVTFKRTIDAD